MAQKATGLHKKIIAGKAKQSKAKQSKDVLQYKK
jgi:hypothetical protein